MSLQDANDEWLESLSLLKFHFAINKGISSTTYQNITSELLDISCQDTEVHLTSRCAGMLEVCSRKGHGSAIPFFTYPVDYLHRTVGEYLEKDRYWSQLLHHTANTEFNPNVSLMHGCILMISKLGKETKSLLRIAHCVLTHAFHADTDATTHKIQTEILDHLNQQMCLLVLPEWMFYLSLGVTEARKELAFLLLATIFGHSGYVRQKLEKHKHLLPSNNFASILLYKLFQDISSSQRLATAPLPKLNMVELLLSFGADPNYLAEGSIDRRRAWEHWLILMADPQIPEDRRYFQIMELLTIQDVDVDRWALSDQQNTILSTVWQRYNSSFPDDCSKIFRAMQLARAQGRRMKRNASIMENEGSDEELMIKLNNHQKRRKEDLGTADNPLVID